MNKKILILLIVVAAIFLGYLFLRGSTPSTAPTAEQPAAQPTTGEVAIISYANNAFTPPMVKIKVGDTIKFVNNHVAAIRVASNPHPLHTSYPKLDSGRLEPGQSYDFTATEKVTVNYHNHFNPAAGGQIVVE